MNKIAKHWMWLAAIASVFTGTLWADEVTDWNKFMFQAALAAQPPTSPLVMSRNAALVQSAVFDAVNGIEPRYNPVHVTPGGHREASRRAAAVQAAYATLVQLYPAQQSTFDAERAASLAGIKASELSIARGIEWGQKVADAIWIWRSTDGFAPSPPPFLGGTNVGEWRPTPPAFLPGAGPQFAYMTPWAILAPSQFRPAGPPSLESEKYAADFYETKTMGSILSSIRTADQTLASQFWNSTTASYFWNTVAVTLSAPRHYSLLQNARLLAFLNIAMADAAIACWEAKYYYLFWRPVTAIPLGATDGNPATRDDANWLPLLVTPAHPEYPSGHSTVSGAAGVVLTRYFGKDISFEVNSDTMPGIIRSFNGFGAALEEVKNARIFAGIHFRSACDDGQATGTAVANYVVEHALGRK
ncbi:MAG TPA: vanadium-dependent haloperoxidase [Terriglobales bacterium]|jgi:hypothetical protein|nr:vanadium-dependent haloperoxidase [Terriglobales bacterium]